MFTKGFDFSAYNGSVAKLFIGGALTYLFMGMYESESAVGAVELSDVDCSLGRGKALLVNAAVNVFAPVVGSAHVSIGKQSSVAAEEGAKNGSCFGCVRYRLRIGFVDVGFLCAVCHLHGKG